MGRRGGWEPGPELPWSADAILGLEEVRLAPSMRDRSGAMWTRARVPFPGWEVELQMRVTGPGRRGAQGMVSGLSPVPAEGVGEGSGGEHRVPVSHRGVKELGPTGCVVHPGQRPNRLCPGGAGLERRHRDPLRLLSPGY